MQAACLVAPRAFEIQEVPLPVLDPGEIRFRVDVCGLCASNLGPWRGAPWFHYPFDPGAPGHEATGTVVEVGPAVEGFRPGDRVAALSTHGFAEYDRVPATAAVTLPPEIQAQPFLGEPLACAVNAAERAGIVPGQWVAIVGLGFFGLLLLQLAQANGGRVLALSSRPESLKMARSLGAAESLDSSDGERAAALVAELTGGEGCPVAIEAAGYQSTLDLASRLVAVRGRLVIAGYHQDGPRSVNLQDWNWRGLDVINAHERDPARYLDGMRRAIDRVLDGSLRPAGLVTHLLPFERLNEAFTLADRRPSGFIKAAILGAA